MKRQKVNSLSGGKTSSYLAYHYPADHEVFALVCIDDHNAGGFIDKSLKIEVNDRLQKSCPGVPEFIATPEDIKVLTAMLDLEQLLGREIKWVRSFIGFEKMIQEVKKMIPNKRHRICTSILKIEPIFWYLYMNNLLPCTMRVGFRWDEKERADSIDNTFIYSPYSFINGMKGWNSRWKKMEWRDCEFPLIEDKTTPLRVQKFWERYDIEFPKDSNCLMCFWKHPQQLRKNFETQPATMAWATVMEAMMDNTFRDDLSMQQIAKIGIQQDFFFGTGAGCQAGFCTN